MANKLDIQLKKLNGNLEHKKSPLKFMQITWTNTRTTQCLVTSSSNFLFTFSSGFEIRSQRSPISTPFSFLFPFFSVVKSPFPMFVVAE